MNLTIQFFLVYLLLWVFVTTKQFMGESDFLNIAVTTLDSARATVQFCPMMSILFVGLRMRALQITDQKGAPQGWAQQGMFLSTYAIMVQVIMVLGLPIFTRSAPEMDEDGNIKPSGGGIMASVLVASVPRLHCAVRRRGDGGDGCLPDHTGDCDGERRASPHGRGGPCPAGRPGVSWLRGTRIFAHCAPRPRRWSFAVSRA